MISDPDEPGRPDRHRTSRQERRARTRAALLDAAEHLWAERGIHGVSLDEIAARAGLTKGAVYSNFSGKSDLVLALLERYTQAELGFGAGPRPHDGDATRPRQDRFADAGRHYARMLSTGEARTRALLLMEFWLFGMRDYAAGWRIADWYHARREELAAELTSGDAPTRPRCEDGPPGVVHGAGDMSAQERASLAMAIDFGLALQHLLDPERVSAELYGIGMSLVFGAARR